MFSLKSPRWLRRLFHNPEGYIRQDKGHQKPAAMVPGDAALSMRTVLLEVREGCTECGACVRACAFLTQYGSPKSIASGWDFSDPEHRNRAYECSLCSLCTAVCPEKLDPCRLFLEIRRYHVAEGFFDKRPYRLMTGYEQRGSSPLFSWYGLPQGCETVFFPGCTLPGTRPAVTMQMYHQLGQRIPALGIVLDCCTKPSHDLGRAAHFHAAFGKVSGFLSRQGVRTVVTACPNCTKIFRQYGDGLAVQTVYEILHASGKGREGSSPMGLEVSVHDPCPLRDDHQVQAAVRGLLSDMGHTVVEMPHHGKQAMCCGEGGAVSFVNQRLSKGWSILRAQEAKKRLLVTYCSGCTATLKRVTPTVHIVDLLFRPDAVLCGKATAAGPPFTYWNRLLLKHRLQRKMRPKMPGSHPHGQ